MKNYNQPNTLGRFGDYGGMYVSETLMPLLINLDQSYQKFRKIKISKELKDLFKIMLEDHPHYIMLKIYLHT